MNKILIAILLTSAALFGQGSKVAYYTMMRASTVANLGTPPAANYISIVTDGNSSSDCTAGGGSTRVLCGYNGSAWAALGGAGGSSSLLSGTLASIPATCTVGAALYQATDQPITTQLYACTATNTWTRASYTQATSAPATCTVGQMFFDTDAAVAGTNLFLCTATNTWTGVNANIAAGGSGALTVTGTSPVTIDIDTAYVPSKTGTNVITGTFDMGGGTLEIPNGTSDPATCAVGQTFFRSDLGVTKVCTATNTWTAIAGGGGQRGTFASLPTCNSTTSGVIYKFTLSFYEDAECDGSSWAYYRDGMAMTQPTGLSALSGTTATTSTTNGGTAISFTNTNRIEAFLATNYAGATKTVTSCFVPGINVSGQFYEVGIILRESGTSKVVAWTAWSESQRIKFNRAYWNNSTSWNSNSVIDSYGGAQGNLMCMRVRKAGGNLNFEYSPDKVNWMTINTTTVTAFFTTDADESGIGGIQNGANNITGYFGHYEVQ